MPTADYQRESLGGSTPQNFGNYFGGEFIDQSPMPTADYQRESLGGSTPQNFGNYFQEPQTEASTDQIEIPDIPQLTDDGKAYLFLSESGYTPDDIQNMQATDYEQLKSMALSGVSPSPGVRIQKTNLDLVEKAQKGLRKYYAENPGKEWGRYIADRAIPFYSTGKQLGEAWYVKNAADKLDAEPITDDEALLLARHLNDHEDAQERANAPGWGGTARRAGDIVANAPALMGELAATGGVGTVAKKAIQKLAVKMLGRTALKRAAARGIGGAAKIATQSALMPQRIAKTAVERQTRFPGDKRPRESWVESFAHGAFQTGVEVGVEMFTGKALRALFGKPLKAMSASLAKSTPALDPLRKSLLEAWTKKTGKSTQEFFKKASSSVGWDGILEELGEERVNEIILGTAGALGAKGEEYDYGVLGGLAEGAAGLPGYFDDSEEIRRIRKKDFDGEKLTTYERSILDNANQRAAGAKAWDKFLSEVIAFSVIGGTMKAGQIAANHYGPRTEGERIADFMESPTRRKWEKMPPEMRKAYPLDPKSSEQERKDIASRMKADFDEQIKLRELERYVEQLKSESSAASNEAGEAVPSTPLVEPKKGGDPGELQKEGQRRERRQGLLNPDVPQTAAGAGAGSAPASGSPKADASDEELIRRFNEQLGEIDEQIAPPEIVREDSTLSAPQKTPIPPDEPRSTGAARLQAQQARTLDIVAGLLDPTEATQSVAGAGVGSAPVVKQPTEDDLRDIQQRIDAIEDELEQQGVNVLRLADPIDPRNEILLTEGGYQPMPPELARLRRRYASVYEALKNQGLTALRASLEGFTDEEKTEILESLGLKQNSLPGFVDQAFKRVDLDPHKHVKKIAIALAVQEYGQEVDDEADIRKETWNKAVRAYEQVLRFKHGPDADRVLQNVRDFYKWETPAQPAAATAGPSPESPQPEPTSSRPIGDAGTAAAPASEPAKQPWEMTRKEWEEQPGLVYHGGRSLYRITSEHAGKATGNPTSRLGAFFTPDIVEARRYVKDFHGGRGEVMPARLNLKNPYMMPFSELDGIIGVEWKKLSFPEGMAEITRRVDTLRADLVAQGYDGIIVGEPGKHRPQEIIAFNSKDIIQHRYVIEDALREGKPVPPAVLADYPDLKPKGTTDVPSPTSPPANQPEAPSGDQPLSLPEQTKQRRKRVKELPAEDQPAAQAVVTTIERAERIAERVAGTEHGAELQEAIAEAKRELAGVLSQETEQTTDDAPESQQSEPEIPKYTRTGPKSDSAEIEGVKAQRENTRNEEADAYEWIRKLSKERDGLKRNATKKRKELDVAIIHHGERQRKAQIQGTAQQRIIDKAKIEDILENPRSYDHYLKAMAELHDLDVYSNLDEKNEAQTRRDQRRGERDDAVSFYQERQNKAQEKSDEYAMKLMARARALAAKDGTLNKDELNSVETEAYRGFSHLTPSLQESVDRAIKRVKEARKGGRDGAIERLYNLGKDRQDAYKAELAAAEQGGADWWDKSEAILERAENEAAAKDEERKAESERVLAENRANLEKAKAANEAAARARGKELAGEKRAWKRLAERTKSANWKKETYTVKEGDKNQNVSQVQGDVIGSFGVREVVERDNGGVAIGKEYTVTHIPTGMPISSYKSKADARSLAVWLAESGVNWESPEVAETGKMTGDDAKTAKRWIKAFDENDLRELNPDEKAAILSASGPKESDVDADLILDSADLGVGTNREAPFVKKAREMAEAVPEFAYNPVFTVQSRGAAKVLMFRDGYEFKFVPEMFNLDSAGLTEGQTVGINLEDLGIKRLGATGMVAAVFKEKGFQVSPFKEGGIALTVKWKLEPRLGRAVTLSLSQGDNGKWYVVNDSGSRGTQAAQIAKQTMDGIRWVQPGQVNGGSPTTAETNAPSPSPPSPPAAPAAPQAGQKPQPWSREAIKSAFGLTDEQAEAVEALAEAMGLDTSRIEIAKGGKSGEGALFQPAPKWRDNILDALSKWQGKGTPEQLKAHLAKSKGTKEQGEWIGLDEFLSGKKSVTRQEVEDFVRANQVQVQEVTKGAVTAEPISTQLREYIEAQFADGRIPSHPDDWMRVANEAEDAARSLSENQKLADWYWKLSEEATRHAEDAALGNQAGGTKHSQWQLPGGENYRELLLTLPERQEKIRLRPEVTRNQVVEAVATAIEANPQWMSKQPVIDELMHTDDVMGTLQRHMPDAEIDEAFKNLTKLQSSDFRSNHFNEPNILAHVRFNDRTDADGKKVLFVEEIQSDWHQKGREKGYTREWSAEEKEEYANLEAQMKVLDAAYIKYNDVAFIKEQRRKGVDDDVIDTQLKERQSVPERVELERQRTKVLERQLALEDIKAGGIPDAPFKQSWPMLAFKRMLQYAAENGYDRIAWTTGEQQAERYDLSKQVDAIEAMRASGGKYLLVIKKDGEAINSQLGLIGSLDANQLESVVGKDLAKKIIDEFPPIDTTEWTAKESKYGWTVKDDSGKPVATELTAASELDAISKAAITYDMVRTKEYAGIDLKVGGEGMKGFYDRMLPSNINKYVKQWGGKVGTTKIALREAIADQEDSIERVRRYREVSDYESEGYIFANGAGVEISANEARRAIEGGDTGVTAFKPPKRELMSEQHSLDINPAIRESIATQGQPLWQGNKASVEFIESGKAVIRSLENPDFSSSAHELAHIARRWRLNRRIPASLRGGITDEEITTVEKWAGAKDGVWNEPAEEKFARAIERYLRSGRAPVAPKIQKIFAKIAEWLKSIYKSLKGSPLDIKISPEVQKVFDALFTRTENAKQEPAAKPSDKSVPVRSEGIPARQEPSATAHQLSLKEYAKSRPGRIEKTADQTRLQALEADHFAAVKQAVTDSLDVPWKAIEPHWDALLRAGLEPQLKAKTLADPKAAPEIARRRFEAAIARKDFRDSLGDIHKEIGRIAKGEAPTTGGLPITKELINAISVATLKGLRAGLKSFQAYIADLKSVFGDDVVRRLKPKLISLWNSQVSDFELDTATDELFEKGMAEEPEEDFPETPMPIGEPGDGSKTTGLKNRKVDELREELGMKPRQRWPGLVGRAFQEAMIKMAKEREAETPGWAASLAASLIQMPRRVTQFEVAGLQLHLQAKKQEYSRAIREFADAFANAKGNDSVDAQAKVIAKKKDAELLKNQVALVAATVDPTKLDWHQMGETFKLELDELFTAIEIEGRLELANNGKKLPDETQEKLPGWEKKYRDAVDEIAKYRAQQEESEAREAAMKAHIAAVEEVLKSKTGTEAKPTEKVDQRTKSARTKKASEKAKAAVDDFLKFVSGRSGVKYSIETATGEAFLKAGAVVKAYIELGYAKFADFMEQLTKDAGVAVKQYEADFREAWDQSHLDDIVSRIPEEYDVNQPSTLAPIARKLHRFVIERDGLTKSPEDREKAVAAVHEILKDEIEGLTEKITTEAMSGIGQFSLRPQDEISRILDEQVGQLQPIARTWYWESNIRPPSTGRQQRPDSDEQRKQRRIEQEAKKKANVPEIIDPEQQRHSALDAARIRKRNRIHDLQEAVKKVRDFIAQKGEKVSEKEMKEFLDKARIKRTKTVLKPDQVLLDLIEQEQEAQADYDEVFGKRELTDEQRAAILEKSLDREIEKLSKEIPEGVLWRESKKKPPVSNPAIEAKRAALNTLLARRNELRLLSPDKIKRDQSDREKELISQIRQISDRLVEGRIMPKEKAAPVPTNENIAALEEQLQMRKDELEHERKSSPAWQERSDAMYLRKLAAQIEHWQQRLRDKDFAKREPVKPQPLPQNIKNAIRDRDLVKAEVYREEHRLEMRNRHPVAKALTLPHSIASFLRTMILSMDLALARQGALLAAGHPIMTARIFRKHFATNPLKDKSLFPTETDAAVAREEIETSYDADQQRIAKLEYLDTSGALSKRAETIASEFVAEHPVIAGAERANATSLNAQKLAAFRLLRDNLVQGGWFVRGDHSAPTDEELRIIGNFLNVAQGRGNFGHWKSMLGAASQAYLSPRYWLGRVQYLLMQPIWSGSPMLPWNGDNKAASGRVRRLMAKEMARGWTGIITLFGTFVAGMTASLGGGGPDKEWEYVIDPWNTKCGQIRLGKTWYDFTFGLGGHLVAGTRLLTGKRSDYRGVTVPIGDKRPYGAQGWYMTFLIYKFDKLDLMPRVFLEWLSGENPRGMPFSWSQFAKDNYIPNLLVKSFVESIGDYGVLRGIAQAAPGTIGFNTQRDETDKTKELRTLAMDAARQLATEDTTKEWRMVDGKRVKATKDDRDDVVTQSARKVLNERFPDWYDQVGILRAAWKAKEGKLPKPDAYGSSSYISAKRRLPAKKPENIDDERLQRAYKKWESQ